MSHRDDVIKKYKELSKPMDLMNVGFVGAAGSSGASAINITSGGTVTTSGDYTIRTFTSSANAVVADGGELEVFIIGGGGSGGNSGGKAGGGGSAGVVNAFDIEAGTYSVVVGAGGSFFGYNGADSTFNGITSQGGGGGTSNGTNLSDCRNCTFPAGITGTVHGNNGMATGTDPRSGGAGAGGNGNAGSAPTAGYGGVGWQLTGFDGTSYYYGGGGGAGGMNNYYTWKGAGDGGSGGAGGGGAGHSAHGNAGTGGGAGQWSRLGNPGSGGRNSGNAGAYQQGGNGGANTGSGSGGAGHTSPYSQCVGGSGIVILRYLTP